MHNLSTIKSLPVVALVGRPNVGKSTLFNRFCGGNQALVYDMPGVTRDRRYGQAEYEGINFSVIDTGGLDFGKSSHLNSLQKQIQKQTHQAIKEASIILVVFDGHEGLATADQEIVQVLRETNKPVLYVVNKVDNTKDELALGDFFSLGIPKLYSISATHGKGMVELLDAIKSQLQATLKNQFALSSSDSQAGFSDPQADSDEPKEVVESSFIKPIRIAFTGRPNAGKSSLVNQLIGEERMIVDGTPGTTRDPINTEIEYKGKSYILIDTAGIRKKARVYEPTEKISVIMAQKSIEQADVVFLIIDSLEGIGEQDAKIAGLVQEAGKSLILVFNKRDLITDFQLKKLQSDRERILNFVPWALEVTCSAKKKKSVEQLLAKANQVYQSYSKRVSTGALNRFFEGIVERHPPPLYRGHPIRLYYITQAQICPPTFILSVNYPQGMHFSYERYLQNQLRETFHFIGTPVRIFAREHRSKK